MFGKKKKKQPKPAKPAIVYRNRPRPVKDALLYTFATTTACAVAFGYAVYAGRVVVPLQRADTAVYDAGIGAPPPPVASNDTSPDMVDQFVAARAAEVEVTR